MWVANRAVPHACGQCGCVQALHAAAPRLQAACGRSRAELLPALSALRSTCVCLSYSSVIEQLGCKLGELEGAGMRGAH